MWLFLNVTSMLACTAVDLYKSAIWLQVLLTDTRRLRRWWSAVVCIPHWQIQCSCVGDLICRKQFSGDGVRRESLYSSSSQCGTFISVCNQPPSSTQPGHSIAGRRNEYQSKGGDALRLGSKGRYGLCVGGRQNCVTLLLHTGYIWALLRCSMIKRYTNSRLPHFPLSADILAVGK